MEKMTEIVVVLDRSTSMTQDAPEVIAGFNQFIKQQQVSTEGKAKVTVVLFDTTDEIWQAGVDIKNFPKLNNKIYVNDGCTALNNAICKAIDSCASRIEECCDCCKPEKVIVLIMTDGQENSSEFTHQDVKSRIEKYKKEGWEFLFIGANIDAFATGVNYGLDNHNITNASKGKGNIAKQFGYANFYCNQVSKGVKSSLINYVSNTDVFEDKDFENNVQNDIGK